MSEGNGFSNNVHQFHSIQDFAFPCYTEDCEDLPHFSRDYTIREAVVTSSQAKGKMRGTTSGANDALADLPKLLQEGGNGISPSMWFEDLSLCTSCGGP